MILSPDLMTQCEVLSPVRVTLEICSCHKGAFSTECHSL